METTPNKNMSIVGNDEADAAILTVCEYLKSFPVSKDEFAFGEKESVGLAGKFSRALLKAAEANANGGCLLCGN